MNFLAHLFRKTPDPLPRPALDAAVAERLAREGRDPDSLAMRSAEPESVPDKPQLPGFSGTVTFEMTVDASGAVKAVALSGADYAHVGVLEAWAYGWRFRPALMDGKPHPCRMVFEVRW